MSRLNLVLLGVIGVLIIVIIIMGQVIALRRFGEVNFLAHANELKKAKKIEAKYDRVNRLLKEEDFSGAYALIKSQERPVFKKKVFIYKNFPVVVSRPDMWIWEDVKTARRVAKLHLHIELLNNQIFYRANYICSD